MEVRKPEFDAARSMMSGPEHGVEGTSRVGSELRAARLRLGWSLEELSQGLRIRLPFLHAIEEGRIGDLPGAAYAVGFVRTYAGTLGLDSDEVARRFRAETQEVNRKTELSFPVPVPERGVPAGAVVLLGLIIAIGAYAAWYKISSVRHDDGGLSAVPERLAPLVDRAAPSNVSPQVASILPLSGPPALATLPSVAPATSTPVTAQAAPLPPVASIPVPVPVPVTMMPTPMPTSSPALQPPADATRVLLRFKADSYIQVREKQGPVLLNRVMRSGDTWPVPKTTNLVMTTGNAGGTDIVVDGITAAPLGASGAVRRDVALDPDAIKLPPGVKLPPQARSQ